MKASIFALCAAVSISLMLCVSAGADVTVDVYSTCGGPIGTGAPYTGFVGSFTSADIMFGTDNTTTNGLWEWHPYGLGSFGADINGFLSVSGAGDYSFGLRADTGATLFIDGASALGNGTIKYHGPETVTGSISLTAGLHPFEIQFDHDSRFDNNQTGLDLYLPSGVTYNAPAVPEASTLMLAFSGLVGIGGTLRLRRK